jgi:hypothetical protein
MGNLMKSAVSMVLLGIAAMALTGCGNSMRSYLEKDTPVQSTSMRGDLTMPPDLRLPPPGTTAPAPDTSTMSNQAALTAPPPPAAATAPAKVASAPAATAPAANPNDPNSIYTQAGISIYKADGTKKTDSELRKELQEYYIAQKRAQNPNYGTVFNIGNIFKDE